MTVAAERSRKRGRRRIRKMTRGRRKEEEKFVPFPVLLF